MSKGPKILFLDIETSPIEAYVWGLWDNNVALNMIKKDWSILSWAAKWGGRKFVSQYDVQHYTEKQILLLLWRFLDRADIVVTQNGKKFDIPKINARFLKYDMNPPSSYQQIDTLKLAKKRFGFTSNKLEYMTKEFNKKYTKQDHKKFPGFELWSECLKGNKSAWREMAKYNKYDVLALEELYNKLIVWDTAVNFNVYYNDGKPHCTCGSTTFVKNGYSITNAGKYNRFQCKACGSEVRVKTNLAKTSYRRVAS